MMRAKLPSLGTALAAVVLTVARLASQDWPMCGGTPQRNMVYAGLPLVGDALHAIGAPAEGAKRP